VLLCVRGCHATQAVVNSRLARHISVSLLFKAAQGVADVLESLQRSMREPSELQWLDALQFRNDVHAVIQVFNTFTGEAHWVIVKSAFSEVVELCELACCQ
jgi:hypothetical protein